MTTRFAALPFTLRRSTDVISGPEITTTDETVHGVMRLESDRLVLQWRLTRTTSRVGKTIDSKSSIDPVAEFSLPVSSLAAATVKTSWWRRQVRLSLIASDLRAFESIAGQGGLKLEHPAALVVNVRRGDLAAAQDFAGELELTIAEQAIARLEGA